MGDPLETLKAELERFGEANDAATNERPRRMLNITRETGELLAVLVRATAARRVLEIGTSNGYSTLWLAEAAKGMDGSVTTVEFDHYKIGLASANFARSGLSSFVTLVHDDAGCLLQRSDESAYDLIFLDSERPEYPRWWPHLRRVLRPGGLLIVDNATSHVEQMAPFVAMVKADPEFATCLIPVGKGEFLAVKTSLACRRTAEIGQIRVGSVCPRVLSSPGVFSTKMALCGVSDRFAQTRKSGSVIEGLARKVISLSD